MAINTFHKGQIVGVLMAHQAGRDADGLCRMDNASRRWRLKTLERKIISPLSG